MGGIIGGLAVLFGCQVVGSFVVELAGLPVPGPVAGMVVLLGILTVTRAGPESGVATAAETLLTHLQLLFVPAGAGVVQYLSLIAAAALPLLAGLVLSWAAALAVTAAVASGCLSLTRRTAGRRS